MNQSSENKVAIVIPTYNRCELLKETVESIFQQTYKQWELIIIDDASTDDTWKWLQTIESEKVRPYHLSENAERSKARNKGTDLSQAEYVLYLDDDDLLYERALETLVAALDENTDAIAAVGGYTIFDESGDLNSMRIIRKKIAINIWKDVLLGWVCTGGHTLFRRSKIIDAGYWNEEYNFAEDHELWLRISEHGPVVLLPDIVLKYRIHGQIRPDNQYQIMHKVRADAVGKKPPKEKRKAEKFLLARNLLTEARKFHYEEAKFFKAFKLYFKILMLVPGLVFSPLSRRMIVYPSIKCLLRKA